MKKKLLFILAGLGILILPNVVFGEVNTIADIVENVRFALNAAVGGVVVISWVIVAILFLIAVGSPEKVSVAKKALNWTLIGTVLFALGNLILVIVSETFLGG